MIILRRDINLMLLKSSTKFSIFNGQYLDNETGNLYNGKILYSSSHVLSIFQRPSQLDRWISEESVLLEPPTWSVPSEIAGDRHINQLESTWFWSCIMVRCPGNGARPNELLSDEAHRITLSLYSRLHRKMWASCRLSPWRRQSCRYIHQGSFVLKTFSLSWLIGCANGLHWGFYYIAERISSKGWGFLVGMLW